LHLVLSADGGHCVHDDPTLGPVDLNIAARQIFPRFRSPQGCAFSPRACRDAVQYADSEHERDVIEMNDVCFGVSGLVQGVSCRIAAMIEETG
jgi:hypothetical protein